MWLLLVLLTTTMNNYNQLARRVKKMKEALGMVETKGLIGSVEAADAMVKAANVTPDRQRADRQRTGNGDGAR